jgi:hypothetical protein
MAHLLVTSAALATLIGIGLSLPIGASAQGVAPPNTAATIPLKEAKLNIEHNATDHDTGFQGAIDSEGWKELEVRGPDGVVLEFEADAPVDIIAYQLVIEKDTDPHPHMIGHPNSLSMYLPPSVTQITVPKGFLQKASPYSWEVLAIEKSGNQTLSSSAFRTR